MKSELLKGALFLRRNLVALIASFVAMKFLVIPTLPLHQLSSSAAANAAGLSIASLLQYGLPIGVYMGFVGQSLLSRAFRDEYEKQSVTNEIKKTAEACRQAAGNLKRNLEFNAQQRLANVLKESDEIMQSYLNGDKTVLKTRAVQQSQKLTLAYVKLADMFRVRSSATGGEKISQLARRINANVNNMNGLKDPGIKEELRRVVESDERMLESLKNERLELEKIDARLQYMESSISMLKYNVISNLESEDILSHLETEVHEADAMNSVLNERYDERREARRIRL